MLRRFFVYVIHRRRARFDDAFWNGTARAAPVRILRPVRCARVGMFAVTLYAGLALRSLSINLLVPIALGGLALLFWEARDGTER